MLALRFLFNFAFPAAKGLHWRQRMALALMQAQRTTIPRGLMHRSLRRAPTGVAVRDYCAKHDIPVKVVTLDPSPTEREVGPPPTLHFVSPPSPRSAGPTLMYFHGGGYVNPILADGHVPFALSCATASGAREVAFVEYALAPEHRYPVQLVQAVASLRYLLEELKIRPSEIIVAGDSAGGNLVGALLAHLAKPSPYARPLDLGGDPLRAALFVSPWAVLGVEQESFQKNDGKDYVDKGQAIDFKEDWRPNEEEVWANIGGVTDAEEVWSRVSSRDSNNLVKKVMVVAGTAEVLLDSCRIFARLVGAETIVGGRGTDWSVLDERPFVFVECDGEVHVQAAIDCAMGYDGGAMKSSILRWLEWC